MNKEQADKIIDRIKAIYPNAENMMGVIFLGERLTVDGEEQWVPDGVKEKIEYHIEIVNNNNECEVIYRNTDIFEFCNTLYAIKQFGEIEAKNEQQ